MEDKNNYKLAFYMTLCGLLIVLLEIDDPIIRKMKYLNITMLLVSTAITIKELYMKFKK